VAAHAVAWALAQLGTPYRWGGEGDGGFDCSGLVQAAFAAAGVALPRVAQDQYDAGPLLPPGVALEPGDLVFFGTSAHGVDHVGIVVQTGEMVDAPHTGAVVRVEPIWPAGYVGATRPAP
jgi:cell wall-associated NlpC family hydrolase